MVDEDSDWITLDEAASYVEARLHCYREKAIDLLLQAADHQKLKTRTVTKAVFFESFVGVERRLIPYRGPTNEIYRKDLLKLWPEHQEGETRNLRPDNTKTSGSRPISDGINKAIDALWPQGIPQGLRAKDRDREILRWLKENNKSISTNIGRAVERVLKEKREAHK